MIMKIQNIYTNQNFKGYENVISYNTTDSHSNNFSYMAMKLNDEGEKDLTKWHEIQKALFPTKTPNDYFIFHSLAFGRDTEFSITDKTLDIYNTQSPQEEKVFLKTFDLMASLTKRIIYSNWTPENGKLYLTLVELQKSLSKIFDYKEVVDMLCSCGAMKDIKHHKTAEIINSNISKKMAQYFRL